MPLSIAGSVSPASRLRNLGMRRVLEDFAQPAANNQVLTRLEHPDPDDDGVFPSGQSSTGGTSARSGVEFNARFARAHFFASLRVQWFERVLDRRSRASAEHDWRRWG